MKTRTPDHEIDHPTRTRSWLAAIVLLAATLAVGAATHGRTGSTGQHAIQAANSGQRVSLTGNLDRTAVMRGGDGLVRMELVMAASRVFAAGAPRIPTDLVVVLDRSGSMQDQKIADARAAVRQLVSQLGAEDRFALVAFSSGSQLEIPLDRAHPSNVARWNQTIDAIEAGGGTQMGPALDLAFDTIDASGHTGRAPRVILISDGLAAESHLELRTKALRAARGEYTLSTVGVGVDFDEDLMSLLSDAGTGNYHYLADSRDLAEIFSNEFETAIETVASGLEVRLTPPTGVSVVEASGYPLDREGSAVVFRPGSLFAGQQRHVWVSFRVPTDAAGPSALGSIELTYSDASTGRASREQLTLEGLPQIACVDEERDFFAALDSERWAKAVAVEEYNGLQAEVARHIKGGRKDEAKHAVNRFRDLNGALNRVAASPSVAAQLDQAVELEASIDEAFDGDDPLEEQHKKQNLLGKALHSSSYEQRREGSHK